MPVGDSSAPVSSAALLDDPQEWGSFGRPAGEVPQDPAQATVWDSQVVLEGMHCAACAGTIEQALRATPGVLEADVSAASHRGRIVWDEQGTRPSAWMRAVQRTGYRPLPAHDAFASARRGMYRALLAASGSRELRRLLPSIHMPIVYAQHRPATLQQVRMRDYQAMCDAVLAGDAAAADAAGMQHVRNVREAIARRLGAVGLAAD